MSRIELLYDRVISYLGGLLSNRQRHDLEKEMMQDVFDEDAFEGLSGLSAEELRSDMDTLNNRLQNRIKPAEKRFLNTYFRIAAALVILVGVGSILYVLLKSPAPTIVAEKSVPEKQVVPAPPEVADTGDPVTEDVQEQAEVPVTLPETQPEPTVDREEVRVNDLAEQEAAGETRVMAEARSEAPPVERREKSARAVTAGEQITGTLRGRIVDSEGIALPGVTIIDQSTNQGTISNIDGSFSIGVASKSSTLAFSYIGYKPLEIAAEEINGSTITLQEDLLALDEVVVVGYGTQKKSDVTGAVSVIEAEEISPGAKSVPYDFIKPVPPGGSLKAYKKWVDDRLDYSKFRDLSGRNKIQVTLTVNNDGSVSNIAIAETAPASLAEELHRIISQSPRWQPALKDSTPVGADIAIRFIITVE
jgi:outer membrane biosynthesis protein TonB